MGWWRRTESFHRYAYAANVAMMFTDREVPDRFAAAAAAGFRAVEYQFPYDLDATAVKGWLADHGLVFALCNTPPGDYRS